MKVIFLDIDGVLNRDATKEKFQKFTGIDGYLCNKLLKFLAHKDYSIVLSSTWREEEAFRDELKRNGLSWVDTTPVMKHLGLKRGFEVEHWLQRNAVDQYAILDDYDAGTFLAQQRPHLIQTSPVHGLRDKDLQRVEKLLDQHH